MTPKHTAMLLLLILLFLAIGMAQERERILDWFEGLGWVAQWLIGVFLILFFTTSIAFLITR